MVGVRDADGQREVAVRVTAPPDGGKANKAVCALLAKELGVPKSSVRIKRGDTSRHKLVDTPLSAAEAQSWLDALPAL